MQFSNRSRRAVQGSRDFSITLGHLNGHAQGLETFFFNIFLRVTVNHLSHQGSFPVVKNPSANAGNTRGVGLTPGLGRSPGGGNGNPFQYSCLKNPVDRGAWQATVHGSQRVRHDLAAKQQCKQVVYNWVLTQKVATVGGQTSGQGERQQPGYNLKCAVFLGGSRGTMEGFTW